MAATAQRARLNRTLGAALIGAIGLLAQLTPIRAQTGTATSDPSAGQVTLFHDDFTTEADRWHLFNLANKASVVYDISGGALDIAINAANYALWSTPDTDLTLDQADMRVQADWSSGNADSQFGLVLDYRSDNDMLVVSASRDGHVRIGHYRSNTWSDITSPASIALDPTQPITVRALLIVVGKTHHLLTFVDDQIVQSIALSDFKAGKFGFFAENGTSGALALALHSFIVDSVANSETF